MARTGESGWLIHCSKRATDASTPPRLARACRSMSAGSLGNPRLRFIFACSSPGYNENIPTHKCFGSGLSADPRKLVAREHVDDSAGSEDGAHNHHTRVRIRNMADDSSLRAVRVTAHGVDNPIGGS